MATSTSNEETIIMENHGIKTVVHEMKVNGFHLVERKTMERKQKTNPNASDNTTRMTIITHSRSIDDHSYSYTVQGSLAEGEAKWLKLK